MFYMIVVPIEKMYTKNANRYYYYMNYREMLSLAYWNPK